MTVETFSPESVNVTMTEKALEHTRKQLAASGAKGIRLGVKKSGCSGFMYEVEMAEEVDTSDKAFQPADDVTLYVTSEALPYVNGIEIDYTTEGLNSSIKFNNPNAKDICGCGESFSVN